MASTTLNIIAGNTFSGRITVSDSTGAAINLTGHVASGFVKYRYSNSGSLFNLNPVVHTSYVSGLIDFHVSGATTLNTPIGKFYYDINIYGPNSYIERVSYGVCEIEPIVTY